jgi:antitoxin MazE
MATKTHIIRIGNSRGLRIPKSLLEQSELPEEVELRAEPGRLIVSGIRRPRAGWSEAARAMRAAGDDELLDEPTATEFDRDDWQW